MISIVIHALINQTHIYRNYCITSIGDWCLSAFLTDFLQFSINNCAAALNTKYIKTLTITILQDPDPPIQIYSFTHNNQSYLINYCHYQAKQNNAANLNVTLPSLLKRTIQQQQQAIAQTIALNNIQLSSSSDYETFQQHAQL